MNAIAEIGILVFREGLECILVLAAVTAGLRGTEKQYRRPIWVGAGIAFLVTLITWCVAVRILNDLSQRVSALSIQAATGLLAIIVLLVVMNWFCCTPIIPSIGTHGEKKHLQRRGGRTSRSFCRSAITPATGACHVMERESYSNPQIAAIVNRDFVAIKVDREERPDVDGVYTRFLEATTGSAGWPMNVFLTPDLKPFFGGTYFPPADRGTLPGLPSVLKKVAGAWQKDREQILDTADKLTRQLSAYSSGIVATVEPSSLQAAYNQIRSDYDATNGGFGAAPKFPRLLHWNT